jgi:O-antigen ligase
MIMKKTISKALSLIGSKDLGQATIVFFAIALQVQITLFESSNYRGLRVGLGDLFLPITGLIVLASLILRKSNWPQWALKHTYIWIAVLASTMTLSTALGSLSSWALINKYVGFLILCCYFLLGGWIAQNVKDALPLFTKWFCGFFVLTIAASAALVNIQALVPLPLWLSDFPWDGFMANRNAYMVAAVFVMISLLVVSKAYDPSFKWIQYLFWLLLPVFSLYNSSRAGWILFTAIIVLYFLRDSIAKAKTILPLILIGIILTAASLYTSKVPIAVMLHQFQMLSSISNNEVEEGQVYNTNQERWIAIEDGLDLYNQSNPLIGAGIGNYRVFQEEKRGEFINIIDFTALWLLVETGALGLLCFLGFFIACSYTLYQRAYREPNQENENIYYQAILFFMIAFAAITFTHELMYTRFVWFVLGLGLGGAVISKDTSVVRK